jgi:hypothetical protein
MRRLQQHDAALGYSSQGRGEQAHLADPRLLHHQVNQRTHRPAASRQLSRQGCMAGLDASGVAAGQLGCSPERWMHCFGVRYGG